MATTSQRQYFEAHPDHSKAHLCCNNLVACTARLGRSNKANKMITGFNPISKTFKSLQLCSNFLGSPAIFRSNPSTKARDFSSFTPRIVRRRGVHGRRIKIKGTVCGILPVDPWAPLINSESIASQLFAASLFPYLGFLYFITKSKSSPKLTLFGFYFLLAFVGATIPAGIYAKVHYGTSLSNVDWLHGGAESLLTLTNLFIVIGLRQALRNAKSGEERTSQSVSKEEKSSV